MRSTKLTAALTALLVMAAGAADASAAKKKTPTRLYYHVKVQFTGTENGTQGAGPWTFRGRTEWYLRTQDPVLITRDKKGVASFDPADMTGYVTSFGGARIRPPYSYPPYAYGPGLSCSEQRTESRLRRRELASGYIGLESSRVGLILDGQPSMPGSGVPPVDIHFVPPRCVATDGRVSAPPVDLAFGRCCRGFMTGGRVMGLSGALAVDHSAISIPLYKVLRFSIPKKDFGSGFAFTRRQDITNIHGSTASFNYTVSFTACDDSAC